MKSSIKIACAVILMLASSWVGQISTVILGGLGICGFNLSSEMIYSVLAASFVAPAITVRFLPGNLWWISGLAFCGFMHLLIPLELFSHEWGRASAAMGCIIVAYASAWLFRPRTVKVRHDSSNPTLE
jgi:hypothetical protein